METEFKFTGKFILSGEILCKTGLHIGGSTTGIEIGGVENPVIKNPATDMPYIPGSSLKGKLRSISEWKLGLVETQSKHNDKYFAYDCKVLEHEENFYTSPQEKKKWQNAKILGKLYGAATDDEKIKELVGPSRLTVRDAFPSEQTIIDWETWMGENVFTEIKTENTLDRVTSEANPRPLERVPAGSIFNFSMIIDIYSPSDKLIITELFSSMNLLENSSLGGSGSRGSGQIYFQKIFCSWRPVSYYLTGQGEKEIDLGGDTIQKIIPQLINFQLPQ
jgi:CRISPR-associated protein Csm3